MSLLRSRCQDEMYNAPQPQSSEIFEDGKKMGEVILRSENDNRANRNNSIKNCIKNQDL